MRNRSGLSLAVLVAAAVLIIPSHALAQRNLTVAPTALNESRFALVIGNSGYKESPLRNPVNDATDVAKVLGELGFRVTLRTNVDKRQMRVAIREFAQTLKRGGVGLFYFAGHGIQSKGKNFLVPVRADVGEEFDLEDEAVDANTVLAGMEEAGNRVNIVILDACRNNPFGKSWRSAAQGLAQMNAPTGSFIAFATAPGSVASDGTGRNGVFTKYLLESLKQPDLDIDRVFTRVTAAVSQETGKKQVPWKSSSLTGTFDFHAGAQVATVPPAGGAFAAAGTDSTANDRAFWESVKDSAIVEEFKAYLTRFPDGQFAVLAKARIARLESQQMPSSITTTIPTTTALSDPTTGGGSGSIVAFADANRISTRLKGRFSDPKALLGAANSAIKRIAENANLDIVFQEAVWVDRRIDITEEVINEVDGKPVNYQRLRDFSQISAKVGFVNLDRILRNAASAQRAQKKIESEFSKRDQELVKMAEQVKDMQENLKNRWATMSESERTRREREVNDLNRDLQRKQQEFREQLNRRRSEELSGVLEIANSAVRQIAVSEKFAIIFQQAVWASAGVDITSEVLRRLDISRR